MHTTIWPEPIWIKVKKSPLLLPQHQSTCQRGQNLHQLKSPLSDPNLFSKSTSSEHCETRFTSYKTVFENFMKWGLRGVISIVADSGLPRLWTLMLRWYLLRLFYFYSDWLWPYCGTLSGYPYIIKKLSWLSWEQTTLKAYWCRKFKWNLSEILVQIIFSRLALVLK